ncbi:MAG: hypothetical protein U0821_15415 [Chloroflexota bacterium]
MLNQTDLINGSGYRAAARLGAFILAAALAVVAVGVDAGPPAHAQSDRQFTDQFRLEDCEFEADASNPYFVLTPGFVAVYAATENGKRLGLTIRVLQETRRFGPATTRILEERHTEDGALVEVSRNYFAVCEPTNDVIYFGEDVDIIENGTVVSHDGAWLHGVNGARAGIIMPGRPLLGARYYQEVAPGVALDRAEIISISEVVQTPAGRFDRVVKTEDTSGLNPNERGNKYYARGVGLVQDGALKLVRHGQHDADDEGDEPQRSPGRRPWRGRGR